MPTQVLPITDLAKAGVIEDTPAVSLPPNVFSDVQNVRFHDGTIRKMEGEEVVLNLINGNDVLYVAWWPNPNLAPNDGYYVVVHRDGANDEFVSIVRASAARLGGSISVANRWIDEDPVPGGQWQHTLVAGGFGIVLNNGLEAPRYILDQEGADISLPGTLNFLPLPNWNSYLAQENIVSVVWDEDNADIPLGTDVSLDFRYTDTGRLRTSGTQRILYRVIPRDPSLPILTQRTSALVTANDPQGDPLPIPLDPDIPQLLDTAFAIPGDSLFSIIFTEGNWMITPRRRDTSTTPATPGAEQGDTIEISIQERPDILVTAGVVRTYGSLLVAGNLREVAGSQVVRNLPGVIPTSDVAAPGNIPANWNPFRNGANTADEFTLSSTGVVQDMVELQGNLFVYTNNSIHSIQQTGGNIPFGVRPVTDSYGAQNMHSVLEFDGKHFVVGSNDIYLFGGHPGSIQSIADSRVRQYFFNDLDPEHQQSLFVLRNQRYDEIWVYYRSRNPAGPDPLPEGNDTALIWNYRENTWTIRRQSFVRSGDIAPQHNSTTGVLNPNVFLPIFATGSEVIEADEPGIFTAGGGNYTSYIERKRFAMTPEFTTENLVAMVLLTEDENTINGATENRDANLFIRVTGTDVPAQNTDLSTTGRSNVTFNTAQNYKVDIREHGRLLNYRITDNGEFEDTGDRYWSITHYSLI